MTSEKNVMRKYNLEELNEKQKKFINSYNSRSNKYIGLILVLGVGSYILKSNEYIMYAVYLGAIAVAGLVLKDRISFKKNLLRLQE